MLAAQAPRIEQLTGLRFVAALAVLVSHYHGLVSAADSPIYAEMGLHGVTLFFILSGYVLTHRYTLQVSGCYEINSTMRNQHMLYSPIRLSNFVVARFARIAPMYWLALALTALAYQVAGFELSLGGHPGGAQATQISFAVNALALQAWVPSESMQQFWNAPGWSISCELFFYACFVGLVRLRWLTGTVRSLAVVVLFFLTLLVGYLLLLHAMGQLNFLMLAFGARLPILALYPFVMGMLLCRAVQRRAQPLRRAGWAVSAAVLALALATWGQAQWAGALASAATGPDLSVAWRLMLVRHSLTVPLLALLIFALVQERGAWQRLLASAPLVLLGHASYGLYLFHWLPLCYLVHRYGVGGLSLAWVVLIVVALQLGCIAVYLGFESPLRRALVQGWARRRALPR